MSGKRMSVKALALLAGSALALSACAADDGGEETSDDSSTAPITFTWGYEQEFAGYNNTSADGNSSANAVVLNQVLRGFWWYAPDGTIGRDEEFGSFEKTSDSPLTVKYTFNDKAVFSDGEPIDCDDLVLSWLSRSGLSGDNGFNPATTAGYEDQNKPECKDGDKTATITYKKPFADWDALYGANELLPAHIVEKNAGVSDIIAVADQPTGADALKAAAWWNTAWQLNPGQLKPDIMPSSGPYTISAWQAGQSLTFKANPKWWGTKPKAETIVFRYLAGDQQAQALQNGEIDASDPQPQVELVNQFKALGDKVNFSTSDQYTYEHLDFNFKTLFADKNLRTAFAKCVPRQQIIDNLIKPVNPDAKILQSRYVFPFEDDYSEFENLGGQNYTTVDIAGAKQLVDAAGKTGTTVRVGWRKDPAAINKRRADTLALIQASCKQAGFNVVDSGTTDFFEKALPTGSYDVAMFAWAGSPVITGSSSQFVTTGESNFGKYSNPTVDTATTQLNGTLEKDAQRPLVKQIETQLWTDLATIPLFAFPGILATTPDAEGVVYNPSQADLSWNMQSWSLKE